MLSRVRLFMEIEPGTTVDVDQALQGRTYELGWEQVHYRLGLTACQANLGLPLEQRIHVWLAIHPLIGRMVKTKEDLDPLVEKRSEYPTEIIKTQILA